LIDSRDASSVTCRIPRVGLLKQPSLRYPYRSARRDRCEDDHYSKNQKLFSKISAQTAGHREIIEMAMKASQIQSHSGTEALKLIAASNDSNLNWRGIFLFVLYTSVVLCFLLFSGDGNYRSVDGPAPRLGYKLVDSIDRKVC